MNDDGWLARAYEDYKTGLVRSAWNILRDVAAAEDAVHTAFVKMARRRKPPEDAKLYAYKAVRHAAINLARGNARRRTCGTIQDHDESQQTTSSIDADLDAELEHAMKKLSPESREVIELHLHSGLSFREIGELTGHPTQTVASRYRRSIAAIRETLTKKIHERD